MNVNAIAYKISTLGPIGFLPASGTAASVVAFPLLYLLRGQISFRIALIVYGFFSLASLLCIHAALVGASSKDPREIVLDEFVGLAWALIFTPHNFWLAIFALVVFRFFDISKWLIVGWAEQLPGAWGVLIDDIFAGLLAAIIVNLFLLIVHI